MVRGNRLLSRKSTATLIFALLMGLFGTSRAEAGLFSAGKLGGFALVEFDGDDSIQLKTGIVLELVNEIADVGSLEIGIAGSSSPIGILGVSVSVKKLAEKWGCSYSPEKGEVFAGLCIGYMPDTEKFLYGVFASVKF